MKASAIKLLPIAILTLFFSVNVNAQDNSVLGDPTNYDQGFKLGLGLNGGIMTDDAYDWALGADIRLQYDFSKRTSITLTTGYTNLFVSDPGKDLGFVPVKAGFKYFWWEDQFYVLGEVGGGFPVAKEYGGQNTVILSPGIGYATKYIDLSVRYEHYSDFPTEDSGKGVGQIALRMAYGFKL